MSFLVKGMKRLELLNIERKSFSTHCLCIKHFLRFLRFCVTLWYSYLLLLWFYSHYCARHAQVVVDRRFFDLPHFPHEEILTVEWCLTRHHVVLCS